jgi:Mg2+ and Co2+ transporter CorA
MGLFSRRGEPTLEQVVKRKGMNLILFFAFVIFGLYFINFPIPFLEVPEYLSQFNNWIIFVGGLLLLLGAIDYFRLKRR